MRYFVSGHRDLTREEFEEHYVPLIRYVLGGDPKAEFVVGDWEGCDQMFLDYMKHIPDNAIYIYGVDKMRNIIPESYTGFPYIRIFRDYSSYDECDEMMTIHSMFDIAWIRPGREDSHTANNIKRRYGL